MSALGLVASLALENGQGAGAIVSRQRYPHQLQPFRQKDQQRFMQRIGQLNLACTQCHDSNAGKRPGSSVIPQAHPTGYPVYRPAWQAPGLLQRRLCNCVSGVRAEPFACGAQKLMELELYLATRARGMAIETPVVRP